MAERDNSLPDGACVISVMHMVNPGMFWISEPPGRDMTIERGELQNLEELLQSHCRHSSFYKHTSHMPEKEEFVAVEHPKTHRWHRGRVEEVLNMVSGFMYKVFLVDHGVVVQVRISSIQELPASCRSLGYQAVQMMLYGVIPITRQLDYETTGMKTMILDHWTAAAVRFVRKLLGECLKTYVVYCKNTKRMLYGDLFMEFEDGIVNLKNLLCENEYAMYDEELFDEDCVVDDDDDDNKPYLACSSTDGCSSHDRNSCSSPKPSARRFERRNIREYLLEFNERKRLKASETLERTKQWTRDSKLFQPDTEDADEETPIGRGVSVRERKEVTPRGLSEKRNAVAERTLDKSLIDLLDMMSGIEETSQRETDVSLQCKNNFNPSLSQQKPREENRSINYMPAGSYIAASPKTKPQVTNHNRIPFSDKNFNKTTPDTNFVKMDKVDKVNSISSKNSTVPDIPKNTKKIAEVVTDSKMLPELPVSESHNAMSPESSEISDTSKNREKTVDNLINSELPISESAKDMDLVNDNKARDKLNIISPEDKDLLDMFESVSKTSETTSPDSKSSKEQSPDKSDGVVTTKSMSLFQRLQERSKKTNKKDNELMENIMVGVIKSSQNKSQVQLDGSKISEQRHSRTASEEHRLKTMMGLLDLMDTLD